jgi:hypothetical protein
MSQSDVPNPCRGGNINTIKIAFKEAKRWLPRAKRVLQEYVKRPDNPRSKIARDALSKHFRWSEDVRKNIIFEDLPGNTIPAVIDRLIQNIDKPIAATCYSTSNFFSPDDKDIRILLANAPRPNTNHFGFAPAFFKKDRVYQATIIIHEMLHSWEGMNDILYEFNIGYPPERHAAATNPDSYAGLIRDLGK